MVQKDRLISPTRSRNDSSIFTELQVTTSKMCGGVRCWAFNGAKASSSACLLYISRGIRVTGGSVLFIFGGLFHMPFALRISSQHIVALAMNMLSDIDAIPPFQGLGIL